MIFSQDSPLILRSSECDGEKIQKLSNSVEKKSLFVWKCSTGTVLLVDFEGLKRFLGLHKVDFLHESVAVNNSVVKAPYEIVMGKRWANYCMKLSRGITVVKRCIESLHNLPLVVAAGNLCMKSLPDTDEKCGTVQRGACCLYGVIATDLRRECRPHCFRDCRFPLVCPYRYCRRRNFPYRCC